MRAIGGAVLAALLASPWAGQAAEPSFDCSKAEGAAEEAICQSDALAALDNELARLYRLALEEPNLTADEKKQLKAMQRGWIKGRNECWKSDLPMEQCVADSYAMRIHELRQGYANTRSPDDQTTLGPFAFHCEGMAAPVSAVFINTDQPLVSLMWGQDGAVTYLTLPLGPSGSGARYAGTDRFGQESIFWNKGNDAMFTPPGGKEMNCATEETG